MKRPRVVLADDHTLLLDAFKRIVEPECEVVGTAADGRALVDIASQRKPDLIVLDISMPLLNGLDAGRIIKKRLPTIKLIYVTMNRDPKLMEEAFRGGASGFLLKTSTGSELQRAIRTVLQGRPYKTPSINAGTTASERNPNDRITVRQREVLRLLAGGRSMKEAALILDVTPRTVAFHKYRMMAGLELKNNAELVQFAIRHSIV